MNRRTFFTLTTAALSTPVIAQSSAKDDGWPTRETLNALFCRYSEFFRSHLAEKYKSLPLEIGDDDWIVGRGDESKISIGPEGEPSLMVVSPREDLQVFLYIQVSKAGQVILAGAGIYQLITRFQDHGKPLPARPLPKWDLPEAINRAQDSLKELGWEIPSDMRLGRVIHRSDAGTCSAVWHRTFDGLAEISSNADADKISVFINEDGEGAEFIRWRRGPVPERTIPRLTSGEALAIAAKAVPLFLAEGTWSQHVMSLNLKDPVLREFKGIELCVTSPNWMTDPSRFKLNILYPRERRLCWRSTFLFAENERADQKNETTESRQKKMLLEIHVDALTGELMGGKDQ